ncbi:hypothetical protein [Streptomyces longispororuber]|uniref:hypothetical protein n=1 Tax=Streptomyces longispororuber TaxID=68230 RepID=UPI00210A3840|nr:hypothetical protein [Streptomyces longispororuber]MCQ4213384.1 hypothetical protein [Streptomyces longispororuber]
MSDRSWPTLRDWLDNAAGANIDDFLSPGHRGKQLLEFYAHDVEDMVAASFGEVTLPALTLYVHVMTRADQILTDSMDDLPEGLQDRTGGEIHNRITAACWIARERGLL